MKKEWTNFENQVRDIASVVFGRPCSKQHIAGVDLDGFIDLQDGSVVCIEITVRNDLKKVREDISKLNSVKNHFLSKGVLARSYIVLDDDPTASMIETAEGQRIIACSISSFAALFFEYERYRVARTAKTFGSSVVPATGLKDETPYVHVKYYSENDKRLLSIDEISRLLMSGKSVVLLGEYGSGKSRCIQELFLSLSGRWQENFTFPFAVNLRDCWGLTRKEEIIRRHILDLGLDDLEGKAVGVFNRGGAIYLLDGFDEIGIQSWSTDDSKQKMLRATALAAVNDLVSHSPKGCLVAGREHYFSSNDEMFSSLGLDKNSAIIVRAQEEFSEEEIQSYFDVAGIDVDLPSWLPRRPLICQTIASLSEEDRLSMFGFGSDEVAFWNHLIDTICARDASIHPAFDKETIKSVFILLARFTRTKPANVGPISLADLDKAFEVTVGTPPVQEASVMLQRLPSLGREKQESQERKFVDNYILDGLRALDIVRMESYSEPQKKDVFDSQWSNPIEFLGQKIVSDYISSNFNRMRSLLNRSAKSENTTLAADISSSFMLTGSDRIDFEGLNISNATFSLFDMSKTIPDNIVISSSIFSNIVVPSSPPKGTKFLGCLAGRVSGVASKAALPTWLALDSVDYFDSTQTVSKIRDAGLSPAHEILATIVKKTFFQKGSGRKEEALLRGFGQSASKKLSDRVLKLLLREGIITAAPGKEGTIYVPNRSEAGRMKAMMEELKSSADAIWREVGELN
ncbi:hypothetical protein J2W22_003687 [Sphingomonas kyeonggiensis]|uniref:hypothetical protein n=1 Tax=Sphingomonas kyeonggiensis TaxID=1268553 RepID=UPI002788797B|nr:hypothetical protein [Sphingomonas kyeonggiensis]MDQ0251599.1 hypothetical protein [Sphingomonas kyeonggiensis]